MIGQQLSESRGCRRSVSVPVVEGNTGRQVPVECQLAAVDTSDENFIIVVRLTVHQ